MKLSFEFAGKPYTLMKDELLARIRCRFVSSEHYTGNFSELVKTNWNADIWKTYALDITDITGFSGGTAYLPITYNLAESCGLTLDVLEQATADNDYTVESLAETLGIPDLDDGKPLMLVISNHDKTQGASAILSKSAQAEICDRLETDKYYIIPSSVHEMLAAPVDVSDPDSVASVIHTINREMVEPVDRLSDHLFLYDKGEISVAA
ncbi:MAG: DUF5688 family protein [Lachnospiraceae bacterium]|nr:DUF5688 family protein [Lachnospiraceae bacterium]